jgi:hypothetical protein
MSNMINPPISPINTSHGKIKQGGKIPADRRRFRFS